MIPWALLLAAPLLAAEPAPAPAAISSTATFACATPTGWLRIDEDDGVTFVGPRDARKVAALVSVRYAPPGGAEADAAAYAARLARKPEFDVPGRKTYPPEKVAVAGRASFRVRKDAAEFVPPHAARPERVPLRQEFVVVPAAKGFYVLLYSAPRSIAAKNRAAFERALADFKPKL